MLIDAEAYDATAHSAVPCTQCHGGADPAADKDAAHDGLIGDPSSDATAACGECHAETVATFATSMHATLAGEHSLFEARSGHDFDTDPAMQAGFEANCQGCHATCGNCHVSRPPSVGGGFISGHVFNKTPDLLNQCTACHGSRIGEEFRGEHRDEIDGYKGDVHYLAGQRCEACHTAAEMHEGSADTRYEVAEMPRCEQCHADTASANMYHTVHMGDLSCHVCHSQDYKSCVDCHVPAGLDESSWLGFKIGKNPASDIRDYKYVTLRHIPIAEDTYAGWGGDETLPNYDALPSWKYATPHNIKRWTDRTEVADGEACSEACHSSPATVDGWFLRQVDLDALLDDSTANQALIVPDTPPTEWD